MKLCDAAVDYRLQKIRIVSKMWQICRFLLRWRQSEWLETSSDWCTPSPFHHRATSAFIRVCVCFRPIRSWRVSRGHAVQPVRVNAAASRAVSWQTPTQGQRYFCFSVTTRRHHLSQLSCLFHQNTLTSGVTCCALHHVYTASTNPFERHICIFDKVEIVVLWFGHIWIQLNSSWFSSL